MQTRNDGTHVILHAAEPIADCRTALDCLCDAPSVRWKSAQLLVRAPQISSATTPWQSAEDCSAHRNSTPECGIVP